MIRRIENTMNTTHWMLDLETLGVRPGAVILQIGAVAFRRDGILGEMQRVISIDSCIEAGMHVEDATVEWWLAQGGTAIRAVAMSRAGDPASVPLGVALDDLAKWMRETPGDRLVWANPPSFDLAILAEAYRLAGRGIPWYHWEERCLRTLVAGSLSYRPTAEPTHVAVEDARAQAYRVMAALWR